MSTGCLGAFMSHAIRCCRSLGSAAYQTEASSWWRKCPNCTSNHLTASQSNWPKNTIQSPPNKITFFLSINFAFLPFHFTSARNAISKINKIWSDLASSGKVSEKANPISHFLSFLVEKMLSVRFHLTSGTHKQTHGQSRDTAGLAGMWRTWNTGKSESVDGWTNERCEPDLGVSDWRVNNRIGAICQSISEWYKTHNTHKNKDRHPRQHNPHVLRSAKWHFPQDYQRIPFNLFFSNGFQRFTCSSAVSCVTSGSMRSPFGIDADSHSCCSCQLLITDSRLMFCVRNTNAANRNVLLNIFILLRQSMCECGCEARVVDASLRNGWFQMRLLY